MGGFITICNGVNFGRAEHFSKTVAVTKEAFIAACKDRVLFNDILGVDIRTGWQNALSDAIEPFKAMKEDFDADTAAKVSSELDVQMRGEDAVKADIAAVEKENAKLEKAAKRAAKPKAKKDEEPAEPAELVLDAAQGQPVPQPEEPKTEEVKDDARPVETTDNSSEDTRGQEDSGLSSDGPRAESAE
jgi:hypothetical protein